jgi:hypothetical protein
MFAAGFHLWQKATVIYGEMQEKRGVLGILGSKALGEARGGCQTRVNKKIDSHIRRGPPGLVNLYLPACDLVQTRAGSKCNRHR